MDSSLKKACILLCQKGKTVFFETYGSDLSASNSKTASDAPSAPSSVTLSAHLDAALKKCGLAPKDIGQIACGLGPGSYTGTRVAISLTQALGFALDIPIAGFCALKALEQPQIEAREKDKSHENRALKIARVIDARSGGLFVFEQGDKEPKKIAVEDITHWLQGISTLLTPHPEVIQEKFRSLELMTPVPSILQADFCCESLVYEGLNAFKEPQRGLSPIYLGKGHSLP